MARWIVSESAEAMDGMGRTVAITVRPARTSGANPFDDESVTIWYDQNDSRAYCTSCSGLLAAMKSSCAHALAVKRAVLAGRVKMPKA